jgi:Domain of unknown function (DUF5658)
VRAAIVNTVLALALALALDGCAVLESKAAVVGCQAADTVTTLHALDLGAREANPVVDWLLKEFGPGGFIAAKIGVTLLFLQVYPEISSDLVILVNGLTCAVAARNATIAEKLERGIPAD